MNLGRNCASGWWVVLLTATLALPVLSDAGVGLFNARLNQVVTSSTLKWANLKKEAMENYVIGADSQQGPIYLCRARHEGDMLLGQLRPDYSSCAVSGSKRYKVFEVLENIENASLIIWKSWYKFNSKPSAAVVVDSSVDSVFVGRVKADDGFSHNIGRIIYESTVGHLITFDEKNNELGEDKGEILVEIEPVSYKMLNVELDLSTEHVRQADPQILEERVLRNDDDVGATVTTEIEYKFNYTLSWGHGHGIATGLNTSIEMIDGKSYQIEWANPFMEVKKELFKLEKYLEPGTACNVTFRGNNTDRDVQYTAKVQTYYKDDNVRSRLMRGERIENTVEVEAIYGEIYYTVNNTLVPTTTTTTTTTSTTTTTTTTTQAPPPPPTVVDSNDVGMIRDSNDILADSSEEVVAKVPPVKEDNIKHSVVGGLGSKPNDASNKMISFAICIPFIILLL